MGKCFADGFLFLFGLPNMVPRLFGFHIIVFEMFLCFGTEVLRAFLLGLGTRVHAYMHTTCDDTQKKYIVAVRTYLVHVSFFFKGDFFTLGNKNVYVCRTVTFFCATVQHPAPVGHAGFPPWKPGELAPQHDRAMDAAGRGKSGCFTDTHRQAARD